MRLTAQQPKALWVLSFGKLWDTFSYFGTQTILALYMIHVFHLTRNNSYIIYGAYAAIAFAIPIAGGILADKWLGSRTALILGGILNIAGNLMLVSFHFYLFALGLATSLVGAGLYKSTSTNLVGLLYEKGNAKKEAGFTWFYLAMNLGGTLAPVTYGLIAYTLGWRFTFLCSAAGMLIGLSWLLFNIKELSIAEKIKQGIARQKIICNICIVTACFLLSIPFYLPNILNPLVSTVFIIAFTYLITITLKYKNQERQNILGLLALCFFGIFYFAAGLQIGITIVFFIQSKINEGLIHIKLPASTFGTFYCLFVLALAPFFTYLWSRLRKDGVNLRAPSKLAIGIGLSALAFACFALATMNVDILFWVILGILLLSAGELALTPAIYTAISDHSPASLKSTMMGAWLLCVAFGGYFSSVLAKLAHYFTHHLFTGYPKYFGEFTVITAVMSVTLLALILFIPRLNKMLQ